MDAGQDGCRTEWMQVRKVHDSMDASNCRRLAEKARTNDRTGQQLTTAD